MSTTSSIFKDIDQLGFLLDTDIDASTPDSVVYRERIAFSIEALFELTFGAGVKSTFTSDPSNDTNGYAYDTVEFDTDDEFNGLTLVITSGNAKGFFYTIDDTVAGSNLVACTGDNLYADGVRSGDEYMITYDIKRTSALGHTHNQVDSATATVGDAQITTVKLKTTTGGASSASGVAQHVTLSGGQYSFYPQHYKTISGVCDARLANAYTGGSPATVEYLAELNSGPGDTAEMVNRYVTSSGPQAFIFWLIEKGSGRWLMRWHAGDHPCYGQPGTEHPFPDFDPKKHELVCVCPDEEMVEETMRATIPSIGGGYYPERDEDEDPVRPERSFFAAFDDLYGVNESKSGDWPDIPLTVGLPRLHKGRMVDWRFTHSRADVKPIRRVIKKPDIVTVLSINGKNKKWLKNKR